MTKSKAQTAVEQSRDDVAGILERLAEVDPGGVYLSDAQAFLTQGKACLEKHLAAEYDVAPLPPESAKPAKADA